MSTKTTCSRAGTSRRNLTRREHGACEVMKTVIGTENFSRPTSWSFYWDIFAHYGIGKHFFSHDPWIILKLDRWVPLSSDPAWSYSYAFKTEIFNNANKNEKS